MGQRQSAKTVRHTAVLDVGEQAWVWNLPALQVLQGAHAVSKEPEQCWRYLPLAPPALPLGPADAHRRHKHGSQYSGSADPPLRA